MKIKTSDIARFMALGEPIEKFGLRWAFKDSFFDDKVQGVMLEKHPERIDYTAGTDLSAPIKVWQHVEAFADSRGEFQYGMLFVYFRDNLAWTTQLLAAVVDYKREESKRRHDPDNTLAQIKQWRLERSLAENATPHTDVKFFDEVGKFRSIAENARVENARLHTHEEAVRFNTLLKKQERDIEQLPKKERLKIPGVAPLCISESPAKVQEYMDGRRRLSPEAYRQAALKENRRRDKIMLHWAESWLALYGIGVTKTLPKK